MFCESVSLKEVLDVVLEVRKKTEGQQQGSFARDGCWGL